MPQMGMLFSALVFCGVLASALRGTAESPGQHYPIGKDAGIVRVGVLPFRSHGKLPRAVAPPFHLSGDESHATNAILCAWQVESRERPPRILRFYRYEYDSVFGSDSEAVRSSTGDFFMSSTRCGSYRDEDCTIAMNGDSVALNGQTIDAASGPSWFGHWPIRAAAISLLPFLFAAQDGTLNERCYVRQVTPRRVEDRNEVWLELLPRYASDAGVFQRLQIILVSPRMTLKATKLESPDGAYSVVHVFDEPSPESGTSR